MRGQDLPWGWCQCNVPLGWAHIRMFLCAISDTLRLYRRFVMARGAANNPWVHDVSHLC